MIGEKPSLAQIISMSLSILRTIWLCLHGALYLHMSLRRIIDPW